MKRLPWRGYTKKLNGWRPTLEVFIMAKNTYGRKSNYNGNSYNRNSSRNGKKSWSQKRQELRDLAYKMGQVERGRKNGDSILAADFNRGATKPTKKDRKTLFGD